MLNINVIFLHPAGSCGSTFINATGGQVVSPNHPGVYPNNLDCQWRLQAADNLRILLTFQAFDLEVGFDQVVVEGTLSGDQVMLFFRP